MLSATLLQCLEARQNSQDKKILGFKTSVTGVSLKNEEIL